MVTAFESDGLEWRVPLFGAEGLDGGRCPQVAAGPLKGLSSITPQRRGESIGRASLRKEPGWSRRERSLDDRALHCGLFLVGRRSSPEPRVVEKLNLFWEKPIPPP